MNQPQQQQPHHPGALQKRHGRRPPPESSFLGSSLHPLPRGLAVMLSSLGLLCPAHLLSLWLHSLLKPWVRILGRTLTALLLPLGSLVTTFSTFWPPLVHPVLFPKRKVVSSLLGPVSSFRCLARLPRLHAGPGFCAGMGMTWFSPCRPHALPCSGAWA